MTKKISKSSLRKRRKVIKHTRRLITAALETDNPIRDDLLDQIKGSAGLSWEEDGYPSYRNIQFHGWVACRYSGEWDSFPFDVEHMIYYEMYMASYPEPDYIDDGNWDHFMDFCRKERIDALKWLKGYPKKFKVPKRIKKALYSMEKAELYRPKW